MNQARLRRMDLFPLCFLGRHYPNSSYITFIPTTLQIFGPVMQIMKFSTIDEVIERANQSEYGLGAAVQTTNIETALKFSHAVRAGTVW